MFNEQLKTLGPPYIASWLKQHGADFGATERLWGDEPLHAAARSGNAPMMAWLMERSRCARSSTPACRA